jgi:AraC family transcriptional regulator, L-rhamnose operon transcriptional activator RhaR
MPEVVPNKSETEGDIPTLAFHHNNLFYINHIARQRSTVAHHHEWLEIAIASRGEARHRTTSGELSFKAGHVFIIPPGTWHAYTCCRGLEIYNCLLSPDLLNGALAWAAADATLGPLLTPAPWQGSSQFQIWKLPQPAMPRLRQLLAALFHTYEESGLARKGKLVAELLLLLDYISQKGQPTHGYSQHPIHSAVRRASLAFSENLSNPWTLPELAADLRINPSYLGRLFRQATGKSPMRFLAEERAHKAAQLLLITPLSVGEIGSQVGWPEPKHFARSFLKYIGESATSFRRRLKRE